jgi:hypothetical protein
MPDEQLKSALERFAPPAAERDERAAWEAVERRATRVRRGRRRMVLAGLAALSAALFVTLAAAEQFPPFVAHSKAPHLLVRGTLYTDGGRRAGTVEIELERSIVTLGHRVRLLRWRQPFAAAFRARWFLELDGGGSDRLRSGSLVLRAGVPHAGKTIATLCAPCGRHDSAEIDLAFAQASALVNGDAAFVGAIEHRGRVSGAVALDRSRLRRGVVCAKPQVRCTRIYSGRP